MAIKARPTTGGNRRVRALRCWLREVIWAGGWVVEAAGVEGRFWIADGRKRPEAAIRRVEKWARANGFAISWQLAARLRSSLTSRNCGVETAGLGSPSRALRRAAERRGLRCRMRNLSWGGGWAAEAAGVDEWLCIADGRKRPETTRRRVEEWARANGIVIVWVEN